MKCDTHINGITCVENIHRKDMETRCVLREVVSMGPQTRLADFVRLCQDGDRGATRFNLFSRLFLNGQGKIFISRNLTLI